MSRSVLSGTQVTCPIRGEQHPIQEQPLPKAQRHTRARTSRSPTYLQQNSQGFLWLPYIAC